VAFELFTPLFNKIDQTTATYVTDISSRAIAAITPVVSVGLTVGFITYGWLIIRGAVEMPVAEFLNRCLRIGIIVSIAMAGGLYQGEIANAITTVPDELASALLGSPTQGASAASLVDESAQKGFDRASEAFEEAGFFSSDGLLYGLFGIIILLATGLLAAIGGAFLLLAKIALALLAGLGPLFILALIWQPTHRFFDQWAQQVLNYGLLIVLFAAVFGLLMNIFGSYMADLRFDGAQNVAYAIGGSVILSIVSVVLLLQLPSIASGLAGGVGLGYMWELRAMRSGAGAAMRGGRALARGVKASPRAVGSAATGAANMAKTVATGGAGVARAAAGYFRGRKAG